MTVSVGTECVPNKVHNRIPSGDDCFCIISFALKKAGLKVLLMGCLEARETF